MRTEHHPKTYIHPVVIEGWVASLRESKALQPKTGLSKALNLSGIVEEVLSTHLPETLSEIILGISADLEKASFAAKKAGKMITVGKSILY